MRRIIRSGRLGMRARLAPQGGSRDDRSVPTTSSSKDKIDLVAANADISQRVIVGSVPTNPHLPDPGPAANARPKFRRERCRSHAPTRQGGAFAVGARQIVGFDIAPPRRLSWW